MDKAIDKAIAIFIDNRPANERTLSAGYNAPSLLTYQRSYWYDQRWEVMDKASPMICGWCGQLTPVYPIDPDGQGGTHCHECDRCVDDFYRNWVYRAEYNDGCKAVLFGNGNSFFCHAPVDSKFNGKHNTHVADELPIYEFLPSPLVNRGFSIEELLLFFRVEMCRFDGKLSESPISTMISDVLNG